MRIPLRGWALLFALLPSLKVAAAAAQTTHEIRVEANPDKEMYRFSPARTIARSGDVLVFRVMSGAPHSVVFEGRGLSEQAHDALNGALTHRAGDLSSPLLTGNGTEYRITMPLLPAGVYDFFCLPHRAYDMRGQVKITK